MYNFNSNSFTNVYTKMYLSLHKKPKNIIIKSIIKYGKVTIKQKKIISNIPLKK